MIDAIWCALALALDGFFVCAALGMIRRSRGDLRLALAFGACDAAASASRLLLGAATRYAPALATFRMLALLILAGCAAAALLSRARRSAAAGGIRRTSRVRSPHHHEPGQPGDGGACGGRVGSHLSPRHGRGEREHGLRRSSPSEGSSRADCGPPLA